MYDRGEKREYACSNMCTIVRINVQNFFLEISCVIVSPPASSSIPFPLTINNA